MLQLMNKAISLNKFVMWFERSKDLLECRKPENLEFEKMLKKAELDFIQKSKVRFSQAQLFRQKIEFRKMQIKHSKQHQASLISGGGTKMQSESLCPSVTKSLREMDGCTLMLHEFLYLVQNASNRLEQISQNHSVSFSSQIQPVQQWEIQTLDQPSRVSHIRLLDEEAFVNKAPHHLVTDSLRRKDTDNPKVIGGDQSKLTAD